MTITTQTWDATTGKGRTHTTVILKSGKVIDSEPVDDPDDPDDSDDDSDDSDDDSDDSDDGMGWDGGDEGPPAIVPKPRSIWDIINDPMGSSDDEEDDDPFGTRIAQALKRGALIIPNAPDTGWGEATGSESLPELKLTPSEALFIHVNVPTDDWGDWNDSRVHVAYIAQLLEAAVHSGKADLAAATRDPSAAEHGCSGGSIHSRAIVGNQARAEWFRGFPSVPGEFVDRVGERR